MGNKESQPPQANPWANVAKAAVDGRSKEAHGLDGEARTLQVNTMSAKLPANLVYSSLALGSDGSLSFDVIVSEECIVDVFLNDKLVESARKLLQPGKQAYSSTLTLSGDDKNRFLIVVRQATASSEASNNRALKVTALVKGSKLLIVNKQADLGGTTVELEEIYGIGAAKECVICITEMSDTAFVPCRHMCSCGDCAAMMMKMSPAERKCPVCRALISSTVKVNTSST